MVEYIIRRARVSESVTQPIPELPVAVTAELPASPVLPVSIPRSRMGPVIARTALAVVGLGMCVGLPLLQSPHDTGRLDMPQEPGSTQTQEPTTSRLPTTPSSPSKNPVEQPQAKAPVLIAPTPIGAPSLCETQDGTVEGQLSFGEPVLSATSARPSIFVVSPDRSAQQSFTVRPAEIFAVGWQTVSEGKNVGIIGVATSDIQLRTTDESVIWAKSCEPTPADATAEVESRTQDLCNKGLKAVVVYSVGADGKPVEMNSTDC